MSNLYRGPPQMHPTKLRFIWPSGFREDFQKSTNQKQESSVAAMFVNGSGQNEQSLQRTFHRYFLPSFGSFGQTVIEEKNFLNQPIRNKSPMATMFVNGSGQKEPSIDASYQVSVLNGLAIFIEDLPQMLPTKFQFIWLRGFRGED